MQGRLTTLLRATLAGAGLALAAAGAFAQPAARPSTDRHPDITVNLAAVLGSTAAAVPTGLSAAPAAGAPSRSTNVPLSGLSLSSLGEPAAPALSRPDDSRGAVSRNGNIVYDVTPRAAFSPYLGLGFGGGSNRVDGIGPRSSGMPSNTGSAIRGYQGVAGVAYTLDKSTKLDLGYRFSNTQRPDVPLGDTTDIAGAQRDSAAIISLHYDLGLMK
jgi:hypothetical protein